MTTCILYPSCPRPSARLRSRRPCRRHLPRSNLWAGRNAIAGASPSSADSSPRRSGAAGRPSPEFSEATAADDLIAELATGTFTGSTGEERAALEMVLSHREWGDRLQELQTQVNRVSMPPAHLHLELRRDDEVIARVRLEAGEFHQAIGQIIPASYSLALDTGRLLWESVLSREDLVWSAAFPHQALPLAADTGELHCASTRRSNLLGRKLVVAVFPGLESGRIRIEGRL